MVIYSVSCLKLLLLLCTVALQAVLAVCLGLPSSLLKLLPFIHPDFWDHPVAGWLETGFYFGSD